MHWKIFNIMEKSSKKKFFFEIFLHKMKKSMKKTKKHNLEHKTHQK